MNLTKSQKIAILMTIFWELFAYNLNFKSYSNRLDFTGFTLASIPAIIYWSVIWIWGAEAFANAGNSLKLIMAKIIKSVKLKKFKCKKRTSDTCATQTSSYKWSFVYWSLFLLFAIAYYNMKSNNMLILKFSVWKYAIGQCIAIILSTCILFLIFKLIVGLLRLVHNLIHKTKNKKQINQKGMPFPLISIILFAVIIAFAYKHSIYSNLYVEKTKQQIVDAYDEAAEGNYNKVNDIDFKPAAEMYDIILSYVGDCFNKIMPEDITTEDNRSWIKTKEGITKLYKRGQKIIQSIDAKQADVQVCYDKAINYYEQQCQNGKVYPICSELIKEVQNVSFEKAVNTVNEIINKRKELIRSEFKIYECLNKKQDTMKCLDEIKRYDNQANDYNKFRSEKIAEMRDDLISISKTK